MTKPHKAVYYICHDLQRDHVGPRVLDVIKRARAPQPTGMSLDGEAVLHEHDPHGNNIFYVPTRDVISHDYPHFVPFMNEHFSDVDIAGVVNWHEGKNAPDAILTVHTTGDVDSGIYGPANPRWCRSLMLAIESHRERVGLDGFSTQTEGTHWSGIPYDGDPRWIVDYPAPVVDIEVGSSPESWTNPMAVEVLASGIFDVFEPRPGDDRLRSLLCVGGVHVEPAFIHAVLATRDAHPVAISHVIPNQWLSSGDYDSEAGYAKLKAAVDSIMGGVHAIAFHGKLKGTFKDVVRRLAAELEIPCFKHKALRNPGELPLWSGES